MAEASDWPDTFPAGSPQWFGAMMAKLNEIEAGDPPASKLAEHAETQEEANLLLELVRRSKGQKPTE